VKSSVVLYHGFDFESANNKDEKNKLIGNLLLEVIFLKIYKEAKEKRNFKL